MSFFHLRIYFSIPPWCCVSDAVAESNKCFGLRRQWYSSMRSMPTWRTHTPHFVRCANLAVIIVITSESHTHLSVSVFVRLLPILLAAALFLDLVPLIGVEWLTTGYLARVSPDAQFWDALHRSVVIPLRLASTRFHYHRQVLFITYFFCVALAKLNSGRPLTRSPEKKMTLLSSSSVSKRKSRTLSPYSAVLASSTVFIIIISFSNFPLFAHTLQPLLEQREKNRRFPP